jgi:hypothetical protein
LLVEALLADASIERFDVGIVRRRAWPTKRQFDPTLMRPSVERLRRELGTVVHLEHLGQPPLGRKPLQDRHDPLPGERTIHLNGGTLTTHVID